MNSAVKIVRVCIGGGNFTGRKRRILSSRTTIACCVMERRFLSASRFNHSCTSRGISFINRPGITNLRYHFAIIILSSYHYCQFDLKFIHTSHSKLFDPGSFSIFARVVDLNTPKESWPQPSHTLECPESPSSHPL